MARGFFTYKRDFLLKIRRLETPTCHNLKAEAAAITSPSE